MPKLLLLNACVRRETSRTQKLCRALVDTLRARAPYEITEIALEAAAIPPLTGASLSQREALLARGELDAPEFRWARMLRDADALVVAAPYWDLSFPASLKCFFEAATIDGITFRYVDDRPVGLCRAKALYYVTTSGGYIGDNNLGYNYVSALCATLYGIGNANFVCAQGLDIAGNDPNALLRAARAEIAARFS